MTILLARERERERERQRERERETTCGARMTMLSATEATDSDGSAFLSAPRASSVTASSASGRSAAV
jgi:hypothetical protein